ncbi:MAG TPA: hypothetical protein PKK15_09830, partial [Kouleothrix sp.]|nr:hypothetical protein [Kouleothrix sp.]
KALPGFAGQGFLKRKRSINRSALCYRGLWLVKNTQYSLLKRHFYLRQSGTFHVWCAKHQTAEYYWIWPNRMLGEGAGGFAARAKSFLARCAARLPPQ